MTEQEFSQSTGRPPGRQELWRLPLVMVASAALLAVVVTTLQLIDERSQLIQLRDAQVPQLREANQLREQLPAIGSQTAHLADSGDATAKKIVAAMKQQGVTLQAPGK